MNIVKERVERLEARHVAPMTEHEVFWGENRKAWERHEEWLRQYDARCEQDRLYRVEVDQRLDKLGVRIDNLVSANGELSRRI